MTPAREMSGADAPGISASAAAGRSAAPKQRHDVTLVLVLHDHQPVGNFDDVFRGAYRDAYAPFLEFLE